MASEVSPTPAPASVALGAGTQAEHPELKSRIENLGRWRELACRTQCPRREIPEACRGPPSRAPRPVCASTCGGKGAAAGKEPLRPFRVGRNSPRP